MCRTSGLVVMCLAALQVPAVGAGEGYEKYAATVLAEPNLVAYWPFEGNGLDARGSLPAQHQGGQPVFGAGPVGGKALVLADKRFVTMGVAESVDLAENTIELWFKPTFTVSPGYNPCLIAKRRSSAETRFSLHIWGDYSCMAFWNGKQVVTFASLGHPLKPNQWYHVVLTCRQGDLKLYVDGLECEATSSVAGFSYEAGRLPLNVGSSTPEGAEYLDAWVDEVAIYSRILTVDEIERHTDAMAAKPRITRQQAAAVVEKRRLEQQRRHQERLGRLMTDENLVHRSAPRIYRGEHLGAIRLPIGGIGTGSIQMDGTAGRPTWQIFNNSTQAVVPNSFFAIRVGTAEGPPVVRAFQTSPVGSLPGVKAIGLQAEYPFGWYTVDDGALPVRIRMEAFNPLIPTDLAASAIPCGIWKVQVTNSSDKPVRVTLLAAQQNAAGYTGKGEIKGRAFGSYGGNTNRVIRRPDATLLHLSSRASNGTPGSDDMALIVCDPNASATASWDSLDSLVSDLTDDGTLSGPRDAGPSRQGQTIDGALASSMAVSPGATVTTTFALTWYFPIARHGHEAWGGAGNMYASLWSNALDVADDLVARIDDLSRRTRLYHDSLYSSNLPIWLIDRIGSQVAVLRTATCFWTRSGYFGGWEGCGCSGGCCQGNCNHVWQYAQAHARLFPELGRIMREQAFRFQAADGGIPHRQPVSHPAFDGQCGDILGAYREHLLSPNGAWLARWWPNIRKAMDYTVATWDKDEDGVLKGPQWNTLDGNLGGSTSWLGTLYLAALAASEKMAVLEGDEAAASRYRKIRQSGSRTQDAALFNGEYYIQIPDAKPQQDYLTGCHIDQVLGQWWANQLDLGAIYPPDHVRTALAALFRHNFRTGFDGIRQLPRKFVADEDFGMQMITWPRGGRPTNHMLYADEVMSGFEYSAAAAMIEAGLLREGLTVLRAASDRYDGRLRTGLTPGDTASWGYSGNPFGDDECGKFYARPMSVWSALLACQGFVCDAPRGLIGFRPPWRPEDHTSFFVGAQGWGMFTQTRQAGRQIDRIELRHGSLKIKQLLFQVPSEAGGIRATVRSAERTLPLTVRQTGTSLEIQLATPLTLGASSTLEATITW